MEAGLPVQRRAVALDRIEHVDGVGLPAAEAPRVGRAVGEHGVAFAEALDHVDHQCRANLRGLAAVGLVREAEGDDVARRDGGVPRCRDLQKGLFGHRMSLSMICHVFRRPGRGPRPAARHPFCAAGRGLLPCPPLLSPAPCAAKVRQVTRPQLTDLPDLPTY